MVALEECKQMEMIVEGLAGRLILIHDTLCELTREVTKYLHPDKHLRKFNNPSLRMWY